MARRIQPTTQAASARKTPRPVPQPEKLPTAKAPAGRAPVVSKDELRAQIEKLERANATLRTKNREATTAAKVSAARIAELGDQLATLEKRAASQRAPAKRSASRPAARGRRGIDPGDAVPPGVAVQEPEPLDREAEGALENLEEHLGERSK